MRNWPSWTAPGSRTGVSAPTRAFIIWNWVQSANDCWAEVSMCWPSPDRRRSWRAMRTAPAVSAAAFSQAWGGPIRTGGRSRSPVSDMVPLEATMVRSVAAQSALGPVWPKALMEAVTRWGLAARRASRAAASSWGPKAPQEMTASAPAASWASSA